MEFAIFSTGRATTLTTDQFISSVKICTLHIREVKCNVTLQIHCYSKHEATAGRDTDREIERDSCLIKAMIRHVGQYVLQRWLYRFDSCHVNKVQLM